MCVCVCVCSNATALARSRPRSKMSRRDRNCRIYVGNLPHDVREKDVEDLFYKYGKIVTLELKNKRDGAPFAFIDFDDDRYRQRENAKRPAPPSTLF